MKRILIALSALTSSFSQPVQALKAFDHEDGPRRTIVWCIKNVQRGRKISDSDLQEIAVKKGTIKDLIYCRQDAVGKVALHGLDYGQIVTWFNLQPSVSSDKVPSMPCSGTTAVVTKRALPAGIRLTQKDIATRSFNPFLVGSHWIARSEFAIGFKTKTSLPAGRIIEPEVITPTPKIRSDANRMRAVFGSTWDSAPKSKY